MVRLRNIFFDRARRLQDAEEDGAVSPQSEAFLLDTDLVFAEHQLQHVHQLDMRDGLEGARHFGLRQGAELGATDEVGVDVGQQLGVLHGCSFLVWLGRARCRLNW